MGGRLQDDHKGRREFRYGKKTSTNSFRGTHRCLVLDGANPSAEGEDAEEGGEGDTTRVLDIQDQFRLNSLEAKPSKKTYQADMKRTCT